MEAQQQVQGILFAKATWKKMKKEYRSPRGRLTVLQGVIRSNHLSELAKFFLNQRLEALNRKINGRTN